VSLYVERERLPPEVDGHRLHAGYQWAVDAHPHLDALPPEKLVASFGDWRARTRPDQLPAIRARRASNLAYGARCLSERPCGS
jgi:hypothetical protein